MNQEMQYMLERRNSQDYFLGVIGIGDLIISSKHKSLLGFVERVRHSELLVRRVEGDLSYRENTGLDTDYLLFVNKRKRRVIATTQAWREIELGTDRISEKDIASLAGKAASKIF